MVIYIIAHYQLCIIIIIIIIIIKRGITLYTILKVKSYKKG